MNELRPLRFQILPTIIKNLIIINVLVYLAQITFKMPRYDFSVDVWFALHAFNSPEFKWWQLITHIFLHGSFEHILFNMFTLWMFGNIIENIWGAKRFLIFYFICGIGAGIIQLIYLNYINDTSSETLGASGAIAGIIAAFMYMFPNSLIYIYFLFPVKAKWLGAIYFGYELYSGIVSKAGDDVAHWAHIGGAIIGLLIVIIWSKGNKNRRSSFFQN